MNNAQDIRWLQRLDQYQKSLAQLMELIQVAQQRTLSKFEEAGLIQYFEVSFDLAWKVLKDYLQAQGLMDIIGSKTAIREAFKNHIIHHGDIWMSMVDSRNLTSHTYNMQIAQNIVHKIQHLFYIELQQLDIKMRELAKKMKGDL